MQEPPPARQKASRAQPPERPQQPTAPQAKGHDESSPMDEIHDAIGTPYAIYEDLLPRFDRTELRRAIIMREILSPPAALRPPQDEL